MEILVFADWINLGRPVLMGRLSVAHIRGNEVFSFSYDKAWLDLGLAQNIDPDLQLFSGPQYLSSDKKNFGIFLDSSPDRWGRVLMLRREAIYARMESRKIKKLFEEDFLLGVYDAHRMGALRFKKELNGPFLHDDATMASPPWASLRELEYASLQLEKEILSDEESLKWLNMLMAPGASLGGARPKASILDKHGELWIAKFPGGSDHVNIGAWEMVVNVLGQKAGLRMAEGQARRFNSKHHSFLTKRFDRTPQGGRIHFASAMTLLGYTDGIDGVSYIDLAEFIIKNGANVRADLEELWRRIVFNIAIKNTDDHLRNHGFLLSSQGWILSPAFDVNPVYHGRGLTLNISESDNSLNFDLAISVAKYFRISLKDAKKIILEVKQAVSLWQKIASSYHIPTSEKDLMEQAFELAKL